MPRPRHPVEQLSLPSDHQAEANLQVTVKWLPYFVDPHCVAL
jgi:hypothetical protein